MEEGAGVGTRGWFRPTIAVGAFLAAVLVSSYRMLRLVIVPGQPSEPGWGLADFRDAVYYPVVALLDGNNPYAAASYSAAYPVGNVFPLYLPVTLVLHIPFGILPFAVAEVAYFLATVALMVVLAYLTLRFCGVEVTIASLFALGVSILASAPGQWNLFLGQCTAQVAAGTYLALYFARRRPWLAGLGVAVVSFKPTSGIPLAVLMLARGDLVPVLGGAALGGGISAVVTALLVRNAGGVSPFLSSLSENYAGFGGDPLVDPATSPYRIDTSAFVGRLFGHSLGSSVDIVALVLILGITAICLRRLSNRSADKDGLLSASLICLAVLACTYHQTYDLVLLALPMTAAACAVWRARVQRSGLLSVALCAMILPSVNYLVDGWTLNKLRPTGAGWMAITSADGAALLIALLMYWLLALRTRRDAIA